MEGQSIFVVDDEPVVCEAIKLYFESAGRFSVRAFTDSFQAWTAMRSSKPDVALLDVMMPSLGGEKLAAMMREHGLTTKVIFLTGLITYEESKNCGFRVGNQIVVGKPAGMGVLHALVDEALSDKAR